MPQGEDWLERATRRARRRNEKSENSFRPMFSNYNPGFRRWQASYKDTRRTSRPTDVKNESQATGGSFDAFLAWVLRNWAQIRRILGMPLELLRLLFRVVPPCTWLYIAAAVMGLSAVFLATATATATARSSITHLGSYLSLSPLNSLLPQWLAGNAQIFDKKEYDLVLGSLSTYHDDLWMGARNLSSILRQSGSDKSSSFSLECLRKALLGSNDLASLAERTGHEILISGSNLKSTDVGQTFAVDIHIQDIVAAIQYESNAFHDKTQKILQESYQASSVLLYLIDQNPADKMADLSWADRFRAIVALPETLLWDSPTVTQKAVARRAKRFINILKGVKGVGDEITKYVNTSQLRQDLVMSVCALERVFQEAASIGEHRYDDLKALGQDGIAGKSVDYENVGRATLHLELWRAMASSQCRISVLEMERFERRRTSLADWKRSTVALSVSLEDLQKRVEGQGGLEKEKDSDAIDVEMTLKTKAQEFRSTLQQTFS
ncbi:uncharacterized protein CCOS01_08480 [Colletotrichum costaricense]|uniref:Uncharacterized protein n=1 Tax=Colletotrichum costaricense TaxID=1209916 RepID=A0AAJ0E0T3_9PEZI|nr:uncharacterized protein CCOS01_08480 [Colletotrichum costaricense]KAK1526062.1 hypothetical protein CCOS01_08480 [Colletotrichum costaricense]